MPRITVTVTVTPPGPLHARVNDFASFLDQDHEDEDFTSLRKSEIIGRPIGGDSFMVSLEASLGQTLRRNKPNSFGYCHRNPRVGGTGIRTRRVTDTEVVTVRKRALVISSAC